LYAYVLNDPLGKADPDGHEGCSFEGIASCSGLNFKSGAAVEQGEQTSGGFGGASAKKLKNVADYIPAYLKIKGSKEARNHTHTDYTYQLYNRENNKLIGPPGESTAYSVIEFFTNEKITGAQPKDQTSETLSIPAFYGEFPDRVGWDKDLPKGNVTEEKDQGFDVEYQVARTDLQR
jgi:hypothetical protein